MNYEWDPGKAARNLRKHGVDFADAALVLEDENALTIEDRDHGESRFRTLGMDPLARVLLVVHCESRRNTIRIISARKATRIERAHYFEGLNHE